MEVEDIVIAEKSDLRTELYHLKTCQFQYLALSITTCGLILGLGPAWSDIVNLIYIAPLVIVLPCWWIFFDKATTISRIVGYYRVLEEVLLERAQAAAVLRFQYIGWENTLKQLRGSEATTAKLTPISRKIRKIFLLVTFSTTHKYWIITWYPFAGMSFLCVFLGISHHLFGLGKGTSTRVTDFDIGEGPFYFVWAVATILFVVSLFRTMYLVLHLVHGKYSYMETERQCRQIMCTVTEHF